MTSHSLIHDSLLELGENFPLILNNRLECALVLENGRLIFENGGLVLLDRRLTSCEDAAVVFRADSEGSVVTVVGAQDTQLVDPSISASSCMHPDFLRAVCRRAKPVAHSHYGENVLRPLGIRFNLLS